MALSVAAPAPTQKLSVAAPAPQQKLSVAAPAPTSPLSVVGSNGGLQGYGYDGVTTLTNNAGSGGGGGSAAASGGGGGYVAPAYVDPYAGTVFGSTANFNKAESDFGAQRDATYGSITDRIGNDANSYHSGMLDYEDSLKTGIRNLNEQGVQNELARTQGNAGVLDMVGHGVRSAGIQLANRSGASDSSAGEAIGQAYGDIGRRANAQVGNQYEAGQHTIDLAAADFNDQMVQGARHLEENKAKIVNGIVSDAQTSIAALNAQAVNASLPDRIDIENKKQEIRNNATARLSSFDGELSSAQAGAKPADRQTNRGQAAKLATAGSTASNPFEYTTSTPAEFQDTGPFNSDLPLFSTAGTKKQNL